LIGYTRITKKYRIFGLLTGVVYELSAVIINESQKNAELLAKHPLPILDTKYIDRMAPDAPRKRGRPRLQRQDAVEMDPANDNKVVETDPIDNDEEEAVEVAPAVIIKKGRGRPRKNPVIISI
jgi:hypothetical protein